LGVVLCGGVGGVLLLCVGWGGGGGGGDCKWGLLINLSTLYFLSYISPLQVIAKLGMTSPNLDIFLRWLVGTSPECALPQSGEGETPEPLPGSWSPYCRGHRTHILPGAKCEAGGIGRGRRKGEGQKKEEQEK